MKVSVGEHRNIVLEEVYNSVVFKTKDGFKMAVCMRDDGFEIGVEDTSVKTEDGSKVFAWYRVTPDSPTIERMGCAAGNPTGLVRRPHCGRG